MLIEQEVEAAGGVSQLTTAMLTCSCLLFPSSTTESQCEVSGNRTCRHGKVQGYSNFEKIFLWSIRKSHSHASGKSDLGNFYQREGQGSNTNRDEIELNDDMFCLGRRPCLAAELRQCRCCIQLARNYAD